MHQNGECHQIERRYSASREFERQLHQLRAKGRYHYSMSFSEMAFLFLLGLILFGPKKLPEMSRQLGRLLGELRRASQEFQSQLTEEVNNLDKDNEIKDTLTNLQVTGTTARERIFNAVLDVGNSIKGPAETKAAPQLQSSNEPIQEKPVATPAMA